MRLSPDSTRNRSDRHRRLITCSLHILVAALLALPLAALAQATGSISGRVFNPANGEYIRNAEVRIDGTRQVAISEDGGYYRLTNAPAGPVTLTATYTGHQTATATLIVTPGTAATRDFELPPTRRGTAGDDAIKLEAFIVSTEREGQAKAISEQKQAMNVKTVVAADNFGDIAEGNVGEFLKFMPGITLDYVETDTRAARMGGMQPRYGYVTIDGNTMANTVSGGSFGADTRQFEFEAFSINNIESIEVNKTLSADMPGDAPAGTVNLRTKSALDRKGRTFNYTIGFIGNQYEYALRPTPRHDDHPHRKSRPTVVFDFSDSFFGNKFGLAFNYSTSSVFKEQFRNSMTYDYTSAQAIAARHPLITAVNFKDGPKMGTKHSAGLKLDYQPFSPALRLSLATSFTQFSDVIANRNLNFRVSAADSTTNAELTKVVAATTANANTRLEQTGSHGNKKNDTTNLALSFNYKAGRLTADGGFSFSRARGQNGSLHMGAVDTAGVQLTRIGWTAERPNNDSSAWSLTQTAGTPGGSWYDLNNWGRFDAQAGNITNTRTRGKTEQYVGQLNARYTMRWELPTFFKAGLHEQVTYRRGDVIFANTYTYVGPTGNQLTSPLPTSPANFRFDQWGVNLSPLPVPDKAALFQLQATNPSYFTQTVANNAANLETLLSSPHSNQETIRSGYVMGNTRAGKWQFQAGGRYEQTGTLSSVPVLVPVSKNPFATRNANGTFAAASTLDYVAYKYSKGMTSDSGDYADFLPSASAKYQIAGNLNLKFGFSKAIKRPNLSQIAGVWSINAADTQITIPNPDLRPERSGKVSAMLEYYFEPAGTVSLHVFQTDLKGSTNTYSQTAAEAGFGNDPIYSAYDFITFQNIPGTRRIKGIELAYSQQLTFLPWAWLRGMNIFANYARFNSNPRPIESINSATGWAPQNGSAGVFYRYKKFNVSLAGTYVDESIIANGLTSALNRGDLQYLKQRVVCDVGAGWSFSRRLNLFVSGRNAFNAGKNWYFKSDHRMQMKEKYGGQWTVGVKGYF
ncbi:MAG: TonB-dependent receptor [Opitutus sp.]|nr:TonB-dependent receptor [Opitutus sp.]